MVQERLSMFCEKCGARIEEGELHCPQCGYPVGDPSPGALLARVKQKPLPNWLWLLGVALLATSLLLGILGLGVAGIYQGLQERARLSREAAAVHHDRGQLYLKQGEYELAQAEFEEALRLAPDYGPAQESLRELQGITLAQLTPTSEVKSQATESFLQEARSFHSQGEWEQAAEKLLLLRRLDANFNEREVENLLFSAYYNQGMQQVEAGRLEGAIQHFDKALEVRPNDPSALRQKEMASLYLTGMEAWGGDWAQATESFEALHRLDGGYMDVASRLYEAHRAYGDLCASEGAWCLAQAQYDRASEVNPTEAIMARWRGAAQRCAESGAAETATPPPDQRRFVGRMGGYVAIAPDRVWVGGRVTDAKGQELPDVEVRISTMGWSATATTDGDGNYVFDDLAGPGRYTLALTQFPSQPVEILVQWGAQVRVDFAEERQE